MKDIFSSIYETWFGLYEQNYDLLFTTLYNDGGYIKFGLTFILIPLICWALFYFVWRYPYGKIWHWLVWLVFIIVIVCGTTWGLVNAEIFSSVDPGLMEALADPASGYETYALSLPMKYAIFNGILTIAISILFSLIMKQFSKIQTHLPI